MAKIQPILSDRKRQIRISSQINYVTVFRQQVTSLPASEGDHTPRMAVAGFIFNEKALVLLGSRSRNLLIELRVEGKFLSARRIQSHGHGRQSRDRKHQIQKERRAIEQEI